MYALTSPEMTHYVNISGVPLQEKLATVPFFRSQVTNDPTSAQENMNWISTAVFSDIRVGGIQVDQ